MRLMKFVWATAAVGTSLALASCNIGKAPEPTIDANAIYTSAAQTMIAGLSDQQTQTAGAVTATPQASPTVQAVFTPLATFAVGTGSVPFGTPFTLGTPFTFGTPGAGLTPLPTAKPAGTGVYSFPVGCDDAMFIGEDPVDSPQNPPHVDSGKVFEKSWSLQNVGTCTWGKGYSFAFKSGAELHPEPSAVVIQSDSDKTEPGHSQAFVITMKAPFKPGTYTAFWQMKNASGVWFGSIVSVNLLIR